MVDGSVGGLLPAVARVSSDHHLDCMTHIGYTEALTGEQALSLVHILSRGCGE
jgi:hypothetical protein